MRTDRQAVRQTHRYFQCSLPALSTRTSHINSKEAIIYSRSCPRDKVKLRNSVCFTCLTICLYTCACVQGKCCESCYKLACDPSQCCGLSSLQVTVCLSVYLYACVCVYEGECSQSNDQSPCQLNQLIWSFVSSCCCPSHSR